VAVAAGRYVIERAGKLNAQRASHPQRVDIPMHECKT
jgi:hypothetical protein